MQKYVQATNTNYRALLKLGYEEMISLDSSLDLESDAEYEEGDILILGNSMRLGWYSNSSSGNGQEVFIVNGKVQLTKTTLRRK